MIDRIIADYERRRKRCRYDLAKINRHHRMNRPYVREMYSKTVSGLRSRIREYDEYIEYLGSVKNEIQRIESGRN